MQNVPKFGCINSTIVDNSVCDFYTLYMAVLLISLNRLLDMDLLGQWIFTC